MPQFTLKIDLGHVLTVLLLIVTMAISFGKFESEIGELTRTIAEMKATQADDIKDLKIIHQNMSNSIEYLKVEQAKNAVKLEIMDSRNKAFNYVR